MTFRPCLTRPSFLSGKFVLNLIQDLARCTWPYHLICQQQRTDVMSSMPSFSCSEAEGVSSLSLMPQIQWLMAWSLRQNCRISSSFGPHISLPWSKHRSLTPLRDLIAQGEHANVATLTTLSCSTAQCYPNMGAITHRWTLRQQQMHFLAIC